MINELKRIIERAKGIVFFGGAGVSTDSGIPDFRGSGGLYTSFDESEDSPEEILSRGYLYNRTEKFFDYYRKNMIYPDARPNSVHYTLAELEKRGKLTAVITQNIDGLHQMAGSKNVIELHGTVARNYCVGCAKEYPLSFIASSVSVPHCDDCRALVRPDVVLYGERLNSESFERAEKYISEADVLIVGGTSLTVNPAASLVGAYKGEHLVIINKTPTPYDSYAEFKLSISLSEIFSQLFDLN